MERRPADHTTVWLTCITSGFMIDADGAETDAERCRDMKNWSILRRSGTWIHIIGVIMKGVLVAYLTAAPAAATERQAVPLKATAIGFDARSVKATAIIVDAQSAGTYCLPMDWADKARFVTAS